MHATTDSDTWQPRLPMGPALAAAAVRGFAPMERAFFAEMAPVAWMAKVLDRIDYGVMVLDADATLRFRNARALDACAADQPMQIENNRVAPRRGDERDAFAAALAAAAKGRHAMLLVRGGATAAPLALACMPLGTPVDAGDAQAVLLVFERRQACEPLSVQFFARTHHLTGAETSVLEALCWGVAPSSIARRGDIAISTVRTHIRSIRQKTDSARIDELVRRVSTLPPMVGVPKEARTAAGAMPGR